MKAIFEIALVIDVPPPSTKIDIAQKLEMAKTMAEKYLKSVGVQVLNSVANPPRKMSKEENMSLVPRSVHFEEDYTKPTACLRYAVKKITKDWKKVTCKECLKRKAKTAQAELF